MGNMSIAIVVVIFGIILGIALLVGLFFLFRAITCWYFKINKMVDELKKIDAHLEKIAFLTEQNLNAQQRATFNSSQATPATPVFAPAPEAAPAAPVFAPAPETTPL